MSHVFISFHNSDQEFVDELVDRLKTYTRLEPWAYSDRLHAGDQWKEEIDRAIEECRALVVVMTPAARASEYVTYEWAYAMGLGKPVVPILLKETGLHPKLGDVQHLDLMASDFWVRLFEDLHRVTESQTRGAQTITLSRDAPLPVRRAVDELDSPDPDRRSKAIEGLSAMRHPAAYEALIMALGHVSYDVRDETARALVELFTGGETGSAALGKLRGTASVLAGLLEALGSTDAIVRYAAAIVLGDIGDAAVVERLALALRDENPDVRKVTAWALGEIGDVRAVEGLVAALRDDDDSVHRAATQALEKIGTPEAREAVARWREGGEGGGQAGS